MSDWFEPAGWEARYSGEGTIWSGKPNPQLVAEVSELRPGTALDVGSGEGGDVIWLAQHGWRVTGADFSAKGLARAARHAREAGVEKLTAWWEIDARTFDPDGRRFDLVASHFLHPSSGMIDLTERLSRAVVHGGHLLVVGHAPNEAHLAAHPEAAVSMCHAEELLDVLDEEDFEILVCEDRPRTVERDGQTVEIADATLFARRRAERVA